MPGGFTIVVEYLTSKEIIPVPIHYFFYEGELRHI